MDNFNPWNLLRGTKKAQEEGLRLVERLYSEEPNGSNRMQLGVAYLWLQRYESAYEHYYTAIHNHPRTGDSDFGMAGVAKWCLGKPDEAISQWRTGLNAKYARASGFGIRMPLLLFFATVRQPNVFDHKLAEKLLREKSADIRIRNWPGPIAKLLLDQVSITDLENYCRGVKSSDAGKTPFSHPSPQETSNCLWLAEFYNSVLGLEQGVLTDFQNSMRKLSDTSQSEWQGENVFVSRLWNEEFFIARYEAATAMQNNVHEK
jgi:hypothetical protein